MRLIARGRNHQPGDVIANRYKLEATLGNGGMGQVFVAENLSIGRRVAVKVLKAELLADATFRRRFQQEAEAIAAIEHKNVARFFDIVVGDPTFLVMEFVSGPTLAETLRRGPMEPARALAVARRLCWALEATHAAGVIHRDIKPSNVILTPDPELGEEPKLIDFGLAKLASVHVGEGLTRSGQIIGTPSYMSPEQIANERVDARSDVYALGCVLYQMLTGMAPFAGSDDVQVLYQQLHQHPPSPRGQVPGLPESIDALLARCLAKKPDARFASMREMAAALAELEAELVPTRSQRALARPVEEPPRMRLALPMIAFALGALAAGGGVWLGSRQAAGGARLLVTSQPAGASVEIDGKRWSETTPTAVAALAPGSHRVRVSAEGHDGVEQMVTLPKDARDSIDVALPAVQRTVEVQSIPAGALVFVDARLVPGRTPTRVALTMDDFHELRLELTGYETQTRAIKPEDRAGDVLLHLEAATQDRGTLWVEGTSAADVYIDGATTGATAPTLGLQVATGTHTVELRSSDGVRLTQQTVTLARGETVHLTPILPQR